MDKTTSIAMAAGALLVVEAAAALVMSGERAYHALNVPLNVALAAALVLLQRRLRPRRFAVIGAWVGAGAAGIAAVGGAWPAATGGAPGWLEGITHSAVLISFLGLALFAAGLLAPPRVDAAARATLLAGGALPVVLVVAGLDDPRVFLAPEAIAGVGLAWTAWGVRAADDTPRS